MAANDRANLACFRFMFCIAAAITYFVAFSIDSCGWVRVPDLGYTWGLWKRCNISDDLDRRWLVPNDQPAYYNAVRTLSCFVLLGFVLSFFTLDQNKGLGEGIKPVGLGFFNLFLLTIMLGVLGHHFKDDDRWKHVDSKLGWCFWVALASGILTLLSTLTVWRMHRLKTGGTNKKVTPKRPPPRTNAKPPPKKKDAKLTTTDSKNQVKPSSTKTDPKPQPNPDPKPPTLPEPVHETPATASDPNPPSPPVLPPPGCSKTAEEKPYLVLADTRQGDEERPPSPSSRSISLDLQPYDIPEMPGQEGHAGVPDYRKAAEGDDTTTPAVALPSSSLWNRTRRAASSSMNFLKNYAKAAVGKGGSSS